jgi:hypothetical protein
VQNDATIQNKTASIMPLSKIGGFSIHHYPSDLCQIAFAPRINHFLQNASQPDTIQADFPDRIDNQHIISRSAITPAQFGFGRNRFYYLFSCHIRHLRQKSQVP